MQISGLNLQLSFLGKDSSYGSFSGSSVNGDVSKKGSVSPKVAALIAVLPEVNVQSGVDGEDVLFKDAATGRLDIPVHFNPQED
ncbi:MAG: hypothetical protein ACI9BD_000157 [Candidatus Marinamargulisbacteria bacterium]|jgi:hypothetical protein